MGLSRRLVEENLMTKEQARETVEAAHKNKQSFLRQALAEEKISRAQLMKSASEEAGCR